MTTIQQQYDNAARAIAQEGRLSPDVSAGALFAYVDTVPGHREALSTVLAAQMRAAQGAPVSEAEMRRIECEQRMIQMLTVLEHHKDNHERFARGTSTGRVFADRNWLIAKEREDFAAAGAELPALLATHRALRPWHPIDGPEGAAA